jgi:DNA replication and repair protein RecF
MILDSISLSNFKNYSETSVSFGKEINCITGLNGSGKTNLLDAIHYLSMTKSAFNSVDGQNIKNGEVFYAINGIFNHKNKLQKVICSLKTGTKKNIKVNDVACTKLSEHLGKFPLVLIAPNDDELIRDSSETRRKFFDSTIAQTNKKYLQNLIEYTHFLKQRNALLKRINETGKRDISLINQYDDKLISIGFQISADRKAFISQYLPEFSTHYKFISDEKELVTIEYKSKALESDFEKIFKASLEKDILMQRTNVGIHRDDYDFLIEEKGLKKFGSQGQQKSFLVSLKLAQFDYLKELFGFKPLLLLDDIFDKLDDTRINKLISLISTDKFQQIFITDAREERTKTLLQSVKVDYKLFLVHDNKVVLQE